MISQSLLELVKRFEGCRLRAYQDQGGVWTCGFGSTGSDVGPNTVWTMEEAENRLESALEHVLEAVRGIVTAPLNQSKEDALCSFSYNCGLGALRHSHLLIFVNKQEWDQAADQFLRWDRIHGVENPGLKKRREEERQLFLQ